MEPEAVIRLNWSHIRTYAKATTANSLLQDNVQKFEKENQN